MPSQTLNPFMALNSTAISSLYQETVLSHNTFIRWTATATLTLVLPLILFLKVRSTKTNVGGNKANGQSNDGSEKDSVIDSKTGGFKNNGLEKPASGWSKGPVQVSKLFIHPIKSCRGTSVPQVRYTPEGLENDRKWCIADAETHAVITARTHPRMVLIHPQIELDDSNPHGGVLKISLPAEFEDQSFSVPLNPTEASLQNWTSLGNVSLWGNNAIDGYVCDFSDPASAKARGLDSPSSILSRYLGKNVLLLCKGPRIRRCGVTDIFPELDASCWYQDGYPLLIMTEESMDSMHEVMQHHIGKQGIDERWRSDKLEIERFRPNLVLHGAGPFAEDLWEQISIDGSQKGQRFTLVSKCARCLLPNVDIRSGVPDKAVPYKVLMKFRTGLIPSDKHKPCVGCNAVPTGSGVINVGDEVTVLRLLE